MTDLGWAAAPTSVSHPLATLAPMERHARIARVAARQHALVATRQAERLGISRKQVSGLAASGYLRSVHRGVYAVAGAPPTWEQALLAAVLAAGDGAVASHASAARLHGFRGFDAAPLELSVERRSRPRLPGVRGHRAQGLDADRSKRAAIPVTSAARTLVDLSGRVGAAELGALLDDGLRRRIVTLDGLAVCVARLHRGPGRRPALVHGALRARLPGYEPGDSDFERHVLDLLHEAGLRGFVAQHRVRVGRRRYVIDIAFPDVGLAIEPDGWDVHRTRTAFDADRARANDLVVAGWTVMRFTWNTPDERIVAMTRAACRRLSSVAS